MGMGYSCPELPKDLRVAQEMMQDGLGRDAAARIRGWLEKTVPLLNPRPSSSWRKPFSSIIVPRSHSPPFPRAVPPS